MTWLLKNYIMKMSIQESMAFSGTLAICLMLNKAVRHFYGMADTLKQLQKNFKGNDIHGHHPMQYIENIVNLYLGT